MYKLHDFIYKIQHSAHSCPPHLNSAQLQMVMFSSITKHFRMLLGQVPVGSTTQNSTQ